MTADLDELLRDTLAAEVTDVTAGDELWDRIRASAAARPGRTARRPAGRSRWYLLSAAAAAVLAAGAVAVWTNHDTHRATEIDPAHPATTATTAPATAPTTATPAIATPTTGTPTTVAPAVDPDKPSEAIAVLGDGRLVRLDLRTGQVESVLDQERYSPPEPGADGYALFRVDYAPHTEDVWYTDCCEPAVGNLYRGTLGSRVGTPRQSAGLGNAVAVRPQGDVVLVLGDDLRVMTPAGQVVATAARVDATQLSSGLWWSPDGTHVALGVFVGAPGPLHQEIRMLRWDGRTLAPDPTFRALTGDAIRWRADGRPMLLPDTFHRSHTTSDGRWTLAVDQASALHLIGPDGDDTVVCPGMAFSDADPLETGHD
jgi:hypothetical protein